MAPTASTSGDGDVEEEQDDFRRGLQDVVDDHFLHAERHVVEPDRHQQDDANRVDGVGDEIDGGEIARVADRERGADGKPRREDGERNRGDARAR